MVHFTDFTASTPLSITNASVRPIYFSRLVRCWRIPLGLRKPRGGAAESVQRLVIHIDASTSSDRSVAHGNRAEYLATVRWLGKICGLPKACRRPVKRIGQRTQTCFEYDDRRHGKLCRLCRKFVSVVNTRLHRVLAGRG